VSNYREEEARAMQLTHNDLFKSYESEPDSINLISEKIAQDIIDEDEYVEMVFDEIDEYHNQAIQELNNNSYLYEQR